MKTLSEIDTTSKRATKAAGFSWGIAEEVGKNMRLLELFGLSGIKNLNQYLKEYKIKQFQKINSISNINESKKAPFCPIILGTNFIDQIKLIDLKKEIEILNIAYPILFLPFASRASEVIGKRIFLKMDEKDFVLNFNQSIYSNYLKSELLEHCKSIKINFLDNTNLFTENEWKELYKLSEDTFVEESNTSKSEGAGAGFTDND
tara:strand:+ start:652 stop:1263 length:612 start_codon:yes stop_codon:yes gene_type:complete